MSTYDAGYLPDDEFCTQDTIRYELARAHDFYTDDIEHIEAIIKELEAKYQNSCESWRALVQVKEAKIKELEQAQPKWISVDDGLPETEQLVLVGCKLFSNVNFVLNVAYYCTARDRFVLVDSTFSWYEINPDDEFFRDGFYDDDEDMAKVTHWMPLLQPPEVK